jgi:hypothetical protein
LASFADRVRCGKHKISFIDALEIQKLCAGEGQNETYWQQQQVNLAETIAAISHTS